MTLWEIIRDWFVINVFGGYSSHGVGYYNTIGQLSRFLGDEEQGVFLAVNSDLNFKVGCLGPYDDYMSIGDWLSTTSTIIVLVILCIIFGLMVRWLFRLTSGLLQGR